MEKNYKVKKISFFSIIEYFIPMFCIGVICSYRLGEQIYPIIYGDEYGYWAAGSFFAGLHWEEITTINKYYGYGYGLFLSLILRFVEDPVLDYRIALYFNVIALSLVYALVLWVEKKILDFAQYKLGEILQVTIALVVTGYSSYIQYVNYTWAEIPTILFTWLGLLCVVKCIEKNNLRNNLFLILVAFILVSIHMRNLGFLIITIVFLIYINWGSRDSKKIIVLFLTTLFCIILFIGIKTFYTGQYYVELSGNSHDSTNEINGIIGKLFNNFSLAYIKQFIVTLIGKVYYLLITSFGVVVFPFFVFIKGIRKVFRKQQLTNFDISIFFGVLYAIVMILTCSIFMIGYNTRFDMLLYGRYFENCIPFLMVLGFIIIFSCGNKVPKNVLFCSVIFILLVTRFIESVQDYSLPKSNVFINLTPIAGWLIKYEYAMGSYIAIGLIIVIVLLVVYSLGNLKQTNLRYVLMVFICLILFVHETSVAYYVLDKGFYNWAINENESDLELLNQIYDLNIQDELAYYPDGYLMHADGLQYLLKNETIEVISEISERDEYILTSSANVEFREFEGYEKIGESKRLILWKKRQ